MLGAVHGLWAPVLFVGVRGVSLRSRLCAHAGRSQEHRAMGTHWVSRLPRSGGSFFPQNQVITFPSSFSLIARDRLVLSFKVGVSLSFWSFLAAGTFMGKGKCMCQVDRILWTQGMV